MAQSGKYSTTWFDTPTGQRGKWYGKYSLRLIFTFYLNRHTRFLSPTDLECAESSTYWQFFYYRPPGKFRWTSPGEGTHSMKVTTYAPPFRPPFFRSLENLYSFDPYFLAKMRKMSYFDPYFLSKFGKMYSFDPPFSPFVAFRVNGRCWASLSKTQPRTPPGEHLWTISTNSGRYR